MTITPHLVGNYADSLYSYLRSHEAFINRIYSDPIEVPTLGVGYALAIKPSPTAQWQRRPDLDRPGQPVSPEPRSAKRSTRQRVSDRTARGNLCISL